MSTDNEAAAVAVEEKAVEYAKYAEWLASEARWFESAKSHVLGLHEDYPHVATSDEHLYDRLSECADLLDLVADAMETRSRIASDKARCFRTAVKALRVEL